MMKAVLSCTMGFVNLPHCVENGISRNVELVLNISRQTNKRQDEENVL